MSSVFETMELAEINQRLSFLDTERRKDKELIATLLERLEAQTNKMEAQSRQIQELEGLLASTRSELVKFGQIESAIEQLRQELTLLLQTSEEKREKAYKELSRLRQVEQENIGRQISEIRKEMRPIPRYDEEIKGLQAEISRLQPPIVTLQHHLAELDKRTEDRLQSIVYLEEQRRQDNQRINKLQSEIPPLGQKIDNLADKIPLLEQAIQIKNKEIDRAAELLDQQVQVIENQRVSEFRWERQISEWGKLVEEMKQETTDMASQAARLREEREMVRRALAGMEPFRERIEKRQDEMAEMQRMSIDRQKRIQEEWQTDREKEWNRFKLENEEHWRENQRLNEKRDDRVNAIEEHLLLIPPQLEALWAVQEAWAQSIMIGPREWVATWNKLNEKRPKVLEPLKPPTHEPPKSSKIRPLPSVQAAKGPEED